MIILLLSNIFYFIYKQNLCVKIDFHVLFKQKNLVSSIFPSLQFSPHSLLSKQLLRQFLSIGKSIKLSFYLILSNYSYCKYVVNTLSSMTFYHEYFCESYIYFVFQTFQISMNKIYLNIYITRLYGWYHLIK